MYIPYYHQTEMVMEDWFEQNQWLRMTRHVGMYKVGIAPKHGSCKLEVFSPNAVQWYLVQLNSFQRA